MKNKKIAIIGKGTAGCLTTISFANNSPLEIDWYFDPNTPEQSVGEGSTLLFPRFLEYNLSIGEPQLKTLLEGTYKNSIRKINYNGSGDFHHSFTLGNSGMHFNANQFQKLVYNGLKNRVNYIPKQITNHSQIDANHIIDCSGKPNNYTEFNQTSSIPVNSAYIVQCYWDKPEFDYTLTVARPYGWVFGIPLQNRCSIGYLYNKNINTLEEVQEDIKEIFKQFNLNPSNKINSFSFNNYYRKKNYIERVTYNGNASFFLEPLEATSIDCMLTINNNLVEMFEGQITQDEANIRYQNFLSMSEQMITMHYFAGSKFKTPFWEYAYNNSLDNINKMASNPLFRLMFKEMEGFLKDKRLGTKLPQIQGFGPWGTFSFSQNIPNLGILDKIKQLIKINDNSNLVI